VVTFVVTEPRLVVLMAWVVNSLLLYTEFFTIGRLGKTSWLYGLFETNLFLVGGLVVTLTRIINSLFYANLLLVVWLEASTVLTLSEIKLSFVWTTVRRELYVNLSTTGVILVWSMLVTFVDVLDILVAARTVSIFDLDLLTSKLVSVVMVFVARKTCLCDGRVMILPSDALLTLRESELLLVFCLGEGFLVLLGVAPIRRREDAEGDRDSGVKVQIAGLLLQRVSLLECLSTCRKEDKKGSLASLG